MHYFDHCASTPVHPDVLKTLLEVNARHYANPASLHRAGVEAGRLIERAREQVAALFQTKASEWVHTSGGTESNNLALQGVARAHQHKGRHIITSAIEHSSVHETLRMLEKEGYEVTHLPVDRSGIVSEDALAAALRPTTILISIMHVNNEMGAVQPLAAIGRQLAGYPNALFHVDGVQSIGKLPVQLKAWGIDLFSASAHKIQGPKGKGWLYIREGVQLAPLFYGGGQERGLRSGTPDAAGIVAAAKALRLAIEGQPARLKRLRELRSLLCAELQQVPRLQLVGSQHEEQMAPHIVQACVPGLKPEVIVHMLEERGFYISTMSACASRAERPSRVLLAMGLPREAAVSALRISLCASHTPEQIRLLAEALQTVIGQLKQLHGERGRQGV